MQGNGRIWFARPLNHVNAMAARGIDGKDHTKPGPFSLITIQGRVYSRVFPLNYTDPKATNLSALCLDDGSARETYVPLYFSFSSQLFFFLL